MGAWGVSAFDNDFGLDWVSDLVAVGTPAVVKAALRRVLETPSFTPVDNLVAVDGLAAAEIVAACAGFPHSQLPEFVAGWVEANRYAFGSDDVRTAVSVVRQIAVGSDLREDWDFSGELAAWSAETANLVDRLICSTFGDQAPP